ncbi:MAG: hypothetical protein HY558_01610 [Euryarchaeota archaeon]|nr:hypothetical protein [Euryarchaeota archaeon]
MGVDRNYSSPAAQYYLLRDRMVVEGIRLLGAAAEKPERVGAKEWQRLGDLSAQILAYAPGYAGKLYLVCARLCYAMAGNKTPRLKAKVASPEALEKEIRQLKKALGM